MSHFFIVLRSDHVIEPADFLFSRHVTVRRAVTGQRIHAESTRVRRIPEAPTLGPAVRNMHVRSRTRPTPRCRHRYACSIRTGAHVTYLG